MDAKKTNAINNPSAIINRGSDNPNITAFPVSDGDERMPAAKKAEQADTNSP
jgi:hypothetical protein